MATLPATFPTPEIDYPTSDGRPMAETDHHRDLMVDLIKTLQKRYAADEMVYVSGNLLVYYEKGNRRRHLAPDVFVVKGVPNHKRKYYQTWQETKGLDVVIELTSSSTQDEDQEHKKHLYKDILQVPEYFMFDPYGDYLNPPLQGFRLVGGDYVPIEPVNGRLPSEVLGLHLEADGSQLRLWDPKTSSWLATPEESQQRDNEARILADQGRIKAEQARINAEQARINAELKSAAAEQERAKADQERAKAAWERDREAEARRKAEDELARLRGQQGRDRGTPPSL